MLCSFRIICNLSGDYFGLISIKRELNFSWGEILADNLFNFWLETPRSSIYSRFPTTYGYSATWSAVVTKLSFLSLFLKISNQVSSPPSVYMAIIISIINNFWNYSLFIMMRWIKRIIIFIPRIWSPAYALFNFPQSLVESGLYSFKAKRSSIFYSRFFDQSFKMRLKFHFWVLTTLLQRSDFDSIF